MSSAATMRGASSYQSYGSSSSRGRNDVVVVPSHTPASAMPHARGSKKVTIEQLSQYFHLPINEVAKELGICATVIKKICRKAGIPRWPHRKIKSMQKMISDLQNSKDRASEDHRSQIDQQIKQVEEKMSFLIHHPQVLTKVSGPSKQSQLLDVLAEEAESHKPDSGLFSRDKRKSNSYSAKYPMSPAQNSYSVNPSRLSSSSSSPIPEQRSSPVKFDRSMFANSNAEGISPYSATSRRHSYPIISAQQSRVARGYAGGNMMVSRFEPPKTAIPSNGEYGMFPSPNSERIASRVNVPFSTSDANPSDSSSNSWPYGGTRKAVDCSKKRSPSSRNLGVLSSVIEADNILPPIRDGFAEEEEIDSAYRRRKRPEKGGGDISSSSDRVTRRRTRRQAVEDDQFNSSNDNSNDNDPKRVKMTGFGYDSPGRGGFADSFVQGMQSIPPSNSNSNSNRSLSSPQSRPKNLPAIVEPYFTSSHTAQSPSALLSVSPRLTRSPSPRMALETSTRGTGLAQYTRSPSTSPRDSNHNFYDVSAFAKAFSSSLYNGSSAFVQPMTLSPAEVGLSGRRGSNSLLPAIPTGSPVNNQYTPSMMSGVRDGFPAVNSMSIPKSPGLVPDHPGMPLVVLPPSKHRSGAPVVPSLR